MINKKFVMFGAIVGMTIGGALPMLWSQTGMFDPVGILLAMVGGIAGIWLAVKISKWYS